MSTTNPKRSRGGRPKSENPRRDQIQVRVTAAEKATIRQIAKSRGLTMSGLLVTLALGAPARP